MTSASQAAQMRRDPWPDNIRLVAVVLVVCIHMAKQIPHDSQMYVALKASMWPFRIPVLVIMAGYFSHASQPDERRSIFLIRNVFLVYVLFELLSDVRYGLVTGRFGLNPAIPNYGLWFLLALIGWRVALPYFSTVRHLLWWALGFSLAVGFFDGFGVKFAAARAVGLFPLFVLGYILSQRGLAATLDRPVVRRAALVAVPAVAVVTTLLWRSIDAPELWVTFAPYPGETFFDLLPYAGLRLVLLTLSAVGALGLMALIPRRRLPVLTYVGSGAFSIYLLHLLVVRHFWDIRLFDFADTPAEVVLVFLGGVPLAFLLGSPPVRRATRWLVQPGYRWPFRSRSSRPADAGAPSASQTVV